MQLKNIFRGDIIKCNGYSNGEILTYKEHSGRVRSRYGKYDQIVSKNTVLICVGEDMYIDLTELCSFSGDISKATVLTTFATGEASYYIDKDSLVEYAYSYIPEDNYKAYGDSDMYDERAKLSKK